MKSRQKRIDDQATAATADARRLIKTLRSGDLLEDGQVYSTCEQVSYATCCAVALESISKAQVMLA